MRQSFLCHLRSFFSSSPEKVKYVQDKDGLFKEVKTFLSTFQVALPLPPRLLSFLSQFAHLTVVSHEMTSSFFAGQPHLHDVTSAKVWALLQDLGLLKVRSLSSSFIFAQDSGDWLELCGKGTNTLAAFGMSFFNM